MLYADSRMVRPQDQQPEQEGLFKSIAMAPVRGIAGAAAGVANLFGADIQDNFGLGHSEDLVGGFLEGTTQFLAGFIPIGGALSKIGVLSSAGKVGAAALKAATARGAVAGAASDFLVFDGNDERISNLIQSIPALQNPVTDFLAASPEDSETWGRLKNTLEGIGLGVAAEGLMGVFGAIRKRNKAAVAGDAQAVAQAEEELGQAAKAAYVDDSFESDGERALRELNEEADAVDAVDSPEAAAGAQDPQPNSTPQQTAQEPSKGVTKDQARELLGWDPTKGDVILVNVDPESTSKFAAGLVHGQSEWDHWTPVKDVQMSLVQLKAGTKTLMSDTKEARKLAGLRKGWSLDNPVNRKRLIEAAKAAGYDTISWPEGRGRATTVLNDSAISHTVQMHPGAPVSKLEAQRKLTRQSGVVDKSPLESAIRALNMGPEVRDQVLNNIHEVQAEIKNVLRVNKDASIEEIMQPFTKIKGFNLAMLSDKEAWGVAYALRDSLDSVYDEVIRTSPKTHDQLIEESASVIAKYTTMSTSDITKAVLIHGENTYEATKSMLAASHIISKWVTELHGLADALINGKVDGMKTRIGEPMTREHALLQFEETLDAFARLSPALSRLRSNFGLGLNAAGISASKMSRVQVISLLERKGGVEATMKRAQRFLEDAKLGGEAYASKIAMKYGNRERLWGAALEYYYFSMLSGIKTLTTNALGSLGVAQWQPIERRIGAWAMSLGADEATKNAAARAARVATRQTRAVAAMNLRALAVLGNSRGLGDIGSAVAKAFKEGTATLLPDERGVIDSSRNTGISRENLGAIVGKPIPKEGQLGRAIDWVAKLTSLPSRLMGGQDEYAKNLVAHSYLESELIEQAYERGLKGSELQSWVDARMNDMIKNGELISEEMFAREADELYRRELHPDPQSRAEHIRNYVTNQMADARVDIQQPKKLQFEDKETEIRGRMSMADRAKRIALEATMTSPLDPKRGALSALGLMVEKYTAQHPMTKLFVPFVRTPMNILIYAADRLPVSSEYLGFMRYLASLPTKSKLIAGERNKFLKTLSTGSEFEKAEAWGRMTTATGVLVGVGTLAASGVLTGKGPTDPEMQQVLRASGWQPYSIKIGDAYISYQRFDPFATLLGVVSDVAELSRWTQEDEGVSDLVWHTAMAIMSNLESKSYLSGLADMAGFLTDPGKFIAKSAKRISGSIIPNLVASTRSATDPYMTEVRGIWDNIANRVPFLSNATQDLSRNVMGEPITKKQLSGVLGTLQGVGEFSLPLSLNYTTSDIVTKELADLAYPFDNPKPQKWGVDLRDYRNDQGQSAYDRWMQLVGEVQIGGRKLRPMLERTIRSNAYQRMTTESVKTADVDSPRISTLTRIISRYRRAAEQQMLSEFSALRDHSRARRIATESLRTGADVDSVRARLFPQEAR